MAFNRYKIQIVVRLFFIAITCLFITHVWQLQAYWITFYNLLFLAGLQVYLLFHYLTRWERDLKIFANSVKHGDYNITFQLLKENETHFELYQMLNTISSYVRNVKSESVQQNHYFQYIVENSPLGLMAYDEKGKILLSNDQALKLLGARKLDFIHQLKDLNPALFSELSSLSLHQPRLLKLSENSAVKLSVRLSKIVIQDRAIYLLSLVNIKSELDENELQSWQDLISVLTHEIMNSVTPIHSLTGSMHKYLDRVSGNEEIIEKARYSLDVISRRSHALMNFVDRYRRISAVPLPQLEDVEISVLINAVLALMQNDLLGIKVSYVATPNVIKGDSSLLEQVLINVIKNAIHALQKTQHKEISIATRSAGDNFQIEVTDNGCGVTAAVADKIFIPFFTTREEGSGIGLTLSRQIMHRHGGSIELYSPSGHGATVILSLPLNRI